MIANKNLKKIFFLVFFLVFSGYSCSKNESIADNNIDPQLIFSSRRWWNYDIFISNIYGGKTTQLTKNKWIDFKPTLSHNFKKIAFISDRSGNRDIYTAELIWLDGFIQWRADSLKNITNSNENNWTPVFSPIENKIAYATYFPENDNYDIFIMNDDGTNIHNITNTSSYEKLPQFSPDGSFIIYQGWQSGKMDIFFGSLIDKNNINLTNSLKSNDILTERNSFSPDGQSIVFTSDRDGNKNIYTMKINGDDLKRLTDNNYDDYEPIFSPTGESIVFTSERDGNQEVYLFDIESKNLTNLTKNNGDDWNPRFYPDGRKIIFQSTRDGNWEIYMMNLNGGSQINLTNHPSTDYSFTVLPLTNP